MIYVGTFSKSLLPSLRVGYLVAPPSLRSALRSARQLTDGYGAPPPSSRSRGSSTTGCWPGTCAGAVEGVRRAARARRRRALAELGLERRPGGGRAAPVGLPRPRARCRGPGPAPAGRGGRAGHPRALHRRSAPAQRPGARLRSRGDGVDHAGHPSAGAGAGSLHARARGARRSATPAPRPRAPTAIPSVTSMCRPVSTSSPRVADERHGRAPPRSQVPARQQPERGGRADDVDQGERAGDHEQRALQPRSDDARCTASVVRRAGRHDQQGAARDRPGCRPSGQPHGQRAVAGQGGAEPGRPGEVGVHRAHREQHGDDGRGGPGPLAQAEHQQVRERRGARCRRRAPSRSRTRCRGRARRSRPTAMAVARGMSRAGSR